MRNWHRSESPQEVGSSKTDYARVKLIALATSRELGFSGRFLLPFAAPVLVLNAPTSLGVSTTSSTQISINWTAPSGTVNHYQIERSTSLSGPFTTIGTSATTSYDDTGLSGVHSYLYRVRAVDSFGAPSPASNMVLGTSIAFTDPTLYANVTEIKAQHIYDLRQAIDAVRALVPSLSTVSWTPNSLDQVLIYATVVQDLRDKLGDALSALNISPGAYEDPTLATGPNGTLIKKVHIEQLRDRSTKGVSTNSGPDDNMSAGSSTARLDPLNRTGGGGEDPLSRNFNWSIPLVGLPGRSGLDLGLSLSYNSLATWTRNGNIISFDDDHGSPAPGFRLGFPVIQGNFYNSQAGKYSYIMITPSGSRLELRQVGTSTKYQSVDSSYVLLDASNMKLRTTDGSQLSYGWMGSDYQCTEIKDRNGNFITINYDGLGRVDTVKDTLSRTITFNYDTSSSLSTITQSWTVNGQTLVHPWATFAYTDIQIQTNFTNLTVYGPSNNSTIHALTQVKLADDSHFDFGYTSWGQIWKISQYTNETTPHLLNYRSYNLPQDNSAAQSDCPRFTQRHDWAENWNLDSNGSAQEVTTYFDVPVDASMPDNSLQTVSMAKVTTPDGTYQKIFYAGSVNGSAGSAPAWQRGLPLATATFGRSDPNSNIVEQRRSLTSWTQDDTNVSYLVNPRTTETNNYDFNSNNQVQNHARTSIEYVAFNLSDGTAVHLPESVKEYQADAATVLRRTHTTYRTEPNNSALLDHVYADLRIIGLVSEKTLDEVNPSNGAETLMSKVSYDYDESGSIQGNDTPIQHDNTYFNSSHVSGRANVSSVTRHNVVTTSQSTTSTMKYNTAGAVVETSDPLTHTVTISYNDQFSANGVDLDGALGYSTLAYPTTVTDPDGFTSTMRYKYSFGGATRKQTPKPNETTTAEGNQNGPEQITEYDTIGRLQKVRNTFNGAYTRYEYGPNFVRTYATVNNAQDEALSIRVFDGAGRTIASASNHPNSVGGYSAQRIVYDSMGRSIKQYNPTETNLETVSLTSPLHPYSWAATGDDDPNNGGAGWASTQQTYDWKGRPQVTTNTDNTTKTASYSGCGCAGGEVVTLTDEGAIDNGAAKRRQQKIYADVLGRTVKTEILNWENGSVYSTITNKYNALDQPTRTRQYAGEAPSPEPETEGAGYQTTKMTYDGYGRLASKHVPEQHADPNNSSTTDHTTWTYKIDDTIETVTDARGASQSFTYSGRHKVTGISFSAPSGVSATPSVSYTYDAAGNRITMIDGMGSVGYGYDSLSRMISEVRSFSQLGRSYELDYGYNLAGQLASVTTPLWAQQVSYNFDSVGRLNSVTANGYSTGYIVDNYNWSWHNQSVDTFVSGINYRAWGAVKSMTYGNDIQLTMSYNGREEPTRYELSNFASQPNAGATYNYYNDGKINQVSKLETHVFDRAYTYDQAGRIKDALTGSEASGGATPDGPYRENFGYDVWGNTVSQTQRIWQNSPVTDSPTITNNRRSDFGYDANGFATNHNDGSLSYIHQYDAAGKRTRLIPVVAWFNGQPAVEFNDSFDGEGQPNRRVDIRREQDPEFGNVYIASSTTTYYLHSTMLGGQVIAELDSQGNKKAGHIYVQGMQFANETPYTVFGPHTIIGWQMVDPVTGTQYTTTIQRSYTLVQELDPVGMDVTNPPPAPDPLSYQPPIYSVPENPVGKLLDFNSNDDIPDWYLNMAHADSDTKLAQWFWNKGMRDRAQEILARNPNVGINVSGNVALLAERTGAHIDQNGTITLWGAEAAAALGIIPQNPTNKGTSMADAEIAKLRGAVAELLQDKACRSFVQGILSTIGDSKRTPFSGDVLKIFDKVTELKGWGWRNAADMNYNNGEGGSYVGNTSETAYINISRGAPRIYGDSSSVGAVGRLVIHELLHVGSSAVGDFSHWDMFKAAYPVAQRLGLKLGTRTPGEKDPGGHDAYNSSGFDDLLFEACQIRKVRGPR